MIDASRLNGLEIEAIAMASDLTRIFGKLGLMEAPEIQLVIDILSRTTGEQDFDSSLEREAFAKIRDALRLMRESAAAPVVFEQKWHPPGAR